ncbi:polysaccharide deacetylase domain protein [TM7 phage DolZOral124_53_65]|nr:polysaccharide deacetylase domain protein [TM7 phage DolZOral124_53_65]
MENAPRDHNHVPGMVFANSVDGTAVPLKGNAETGSILLEIAAGSGVIENAPRDQNFIPGLVAADADTGEAFAVQGNATTGAIFAEVAGAGGGGGNALPLTESYNPVIPDLPGLTYITTFQPGHGFNSNSSGSQNYGYTTDHFLGDQCFYIQTNGSGGYKYCQHRNDALNIDATNKQFGILLKISDVDRLDEMQFFVGDGLFSNYYKWSALEGYQGTKWFLDDDWVLLTFSFARATVHGSPDRSRLTDIRISVRDDSSAPIEVLYNAIVLVDQEPPVVSFSFDDGFVSQYTKAYPVLSAKGFKPTLYVTPSYIDQTGRLSTAQLQEMMSFGVELGGHDTSNNDRVYTETELVTRIETQLQTYIDKLRIRPAGFAYPGGQFGYLTDGSGTTVEEVYARYYKYARTINQANRELPTPAKMSRLRVFYVTNAVTPAQVLDALNLAKANGEWFHVVFHDIVDSGAATTVQYNLADFQQIVDDVEASGVPVKTVNEVCFGKSQTTPENSGNIDGGTP